MKFVFLLLWATVLVSCKVAPAADTAALKEGSGGGDAGCLCSDLECWKHKTNEEVGKQLQCLKSTAEAAAAISGFQVLEIAAALSQAATAFSDPSVREVFSSGGGDGAAELRGGEAFSLNDGEPPLAPFDGAQDVPQEGGADGEAPQPSDPNKAAGKISDGSEKVLGAAGKAAALAARKCLGGTLGEISALMGIINGATKVDVKSAGGIASIFKTLGSQVGAISNIVTMIDSCLGGLDEKAQAGLKAFGTTLKTVSQYLIVIQNVIKCGAGFGTGGYYLLYNGVCAMRDLSEVASVSDKVSQMAQDFNKTSKQEERQYGATTCVDAIKGAAYLGVWRPLTDCSACCGGTKFASPGYTECSEKWKTCMLACGEAFGQNNPRFFYSNSAVTDYSGAKCAE